MISAADLVAPVLVQSDHRPDEDYRHLPGAVALSDVAAHARELRRWCASGEAVRLRGEQDPEAREALEPTNLQVVAMQAIRATVEGMVIATEMCGCAWTIPASARRSACTAVPTHDTRSSPMAVHQAEQVAPPGCARRRHHRTAGTLQLADRRLHHH